MTHTPDEIRGLHRALHVACGLPALSPSMGDTHAWWDFLRELAPLADSPDAGGPVTVADIQAAVGEMKRQNKANEARWSLRPGKILREPEAFRDLILIVRSRRRADSRPRRPEFVEVERRDGDIRRRVEVPADQITETQRADFLAACQKLRQKISARLNT